MKDMNIIIVAMNKIWVINMNITLNLIKNFKKLDNLFTNIQMGNINYN